jgi:transposase InsO family protein
MTARLVTDVLVMAIWRHGRPEALLHHSDRSQYTSEQLQRLMADNDVTRPVSRSGNVLDNAVLVAEDRADGQQDVSFPRPRPSRRVRLHRALLQRDPQALDARLSQPGRVRETGSVSLTACPRNQLQTNLTQEKSTL